jgi:hypothetical protein
MRIDDDSILSRMFGFVVILAGVGLWPIYLNAESVPGDDPGVWGLMLALGTGLVCALVGLAMMLYSGQTNIDRRLGKVVHWQRFLWWRPTSEHELEDFHRVVIVRSGRPAYRTWGIELQTDPPDPARTVLCGLGLSRPDAEALAERVADFVGVAVEDSSAVARPRR